MCSVNMSYSSPTLLRMRIPEEPDTTSVLHYLKYPDTIPSMWHEARKQEKKLREAMIDYQRRAERRREHYAKMVSRLLVIPNNAHREYVLSLSLPPVAW